MTEEELIQKILDYIKTLYSAEYTGELTVLKSNPGYVMSIAIPSYMFPTVIMCDFETDDEFLNYIYEELRIRNYMRVYFYQVNRTPNDTEQ